MKSAIISIALLLSTTSYATVRDLTKEFLLKNFELTSSKANVELAKLSVNSVIASKFWGLSASGSIYDNTLDTESGSTASHAERTTGSVALSKDFIWGGHFSLDNSLTKTDFPSSTTSVFGFNQTVSYTQDLGRNFFGRGDRIDIALAEDGHELAKASHKVVEDSQLLSFYNAYLAAGLSHSLDELQKEAHKRAIKRTNLIRRRVRDGLREKVDLFQSQMAERSQAEAVKNNEIDFINSMNILDDLFHRKLDKSEIKGLSIDKFKLSKLPTGKWSDNKHNLLISEKKKLAQRTLEKVEQSFVPDLSLVGSYKTNSYDNSQGTSLSDGNALSGENEELTVALNLTWAIGNLPSKVERSKSRVELMVTEKELEKTKINFERSESALVSQINVLDQNISSATERLKLAERVLREYTKLYNLGRADLDQLILAEESLIKTQNSFVNYLTSREKLVASLAFLYGDLKGYLLTK